MLLYGTKVEIIFLKRVISFVTMKGLQD